ncbi:hypothetical protein NXX91_21970 [Bacteroides thetaiotaomicron]|nr:hypothetical protein [Bacteroides thetaiotaomicron]
MKDSRSGVRKTDGCSRSPTLPEGYWKVRDRRTAYPARTEAYGSRRTPTKGSPSNWKVSTRHRREQPMVP